MSKEFNKFREYALEHDCSIKESECACEKCSQMCQAPCCGTPNEIKNIIKAGFSDRLMLDDLPGGPEMLKPALKGYEGQQAPWEVASSEGCTFWINGKCELHKLKLKPLQGRLAHHSLSNDENDRIGEMVFNAWEQDSAEEVIDLWQSLHPNYL